MASSNSKYYYNPTLGKISDQDLIKELINFMSEDTKRKYGIIIGTDSQEKNGKDEKIVDFITAIVIHRIGRGGRYFWVRSHENNFATLRDRIYREVLLSLNTAQVVIDNLRKLKLTHSIPEYGFEIHVDIGNNGPTRDMIKEVVGMIRGNGFNAKIKPEAYGASKVADRHT